MNQSIRNKIRRLTLGPVLALGIVAYVAFVFLTRSEIRQRTSMDVNAARSTLDTFLNEKREHLEIETKLLSQEPHFAAFANSSDVWGASPPDRKTAQASVDSYGFKDGMILVTKSGSELACSGPLKGVTPDTILKLGWNQAQDGKPWSGLVALPQGLFLAAASPFMVNGYAKGAAICYAPMNDTTLKALAGQLSVEIAFVSGNKVEAASEPSMKPFQITEGGSPIITSIHGQDYVGAYSHLSAAGANTGFVTFRNANEIVGPSKIFLLAFFGILALGTFLAVGLSEAFTGNLVRPLEALVQAALRLSRGEYPEPFCPNRKDEIGLLQDTFDKMTRSLQEHEAKLRTMIDVDPLTELVNHRRFKELLATAMEKEERLSIVVFDLDHFSDYNRSKGFADGDEILKGCARLLDEMTPADGQVARYGGEEFAVMLPGHSLDSAAKFANGVLWSFSNQGYGLTLSAGCAEQGPGTAQASSLCLAADLALAQAKQLGRNRVTDFNAIAQNGADPYELNRFLQDGTIATIQALAAAVDAKDSYTKGHSQRVAEYAADLCRYVGGSDAEVELVYRTGTLHDVGKIGVPDHVLKKAGPLTPEERAVMETHPALGEVIVRKVPQLQDTLPGVRHHHERWDGKGYPDGLAGASIPLLGRILAVADTYDAMTSDRPYRKGLPVEVALEEIAKNAGVQFEPRLAEAFVRMMREKMPLAEAA